GQLLIACLACPQLGVNIPNGWESVDGEDKYLYALLVLMNTNFKLKNHMQSANEADLGLVTGLAYFVKPMGYSQHLKHLATQTDTSTCNGFKAITSAKTKILSGIRSTGVHACFYLVAYLLMILSYHNMDWVLLTTLLSFALITLYIIYNIACQFKIHFKDQMCQVPDKLQLPDGIEPQFTILKCHCPVHKQKCQTLHSLNLMLGVGRTDGEEIEQDWSSLNPIFNSTNPCMSQGNHDG
ncbi:hypothetical protein BDN71DRAFT_1392574, partial [Pleurotus eryngii]